MDHLNRTEWNIMRDGNRPEAKFSSSYISIYLIIQLTPINLTS